MAVPLLINSHKPPVLLVGPGCAMRVGGLFKVKFTARSHLLAQAAKYAKSIIFPFAGQSTKNQADKSANEKLRFFVYIERLALSRVPIGLGLTNINGCFCFSVPRKGKEDIPLASLASLR